MADGQLHKVGFIIQARMGSTRLEGKILKNLPFNAKQTILEIIIDRLAQSSYNGETWVATSLNIENDVISKLVKSISNVHVYKGDEEDVLNRFVKIQEKENFDIIVRLTSDNPCVDVELLDQTIKKHVDLNSDYTYTTNYPLGMNFEVINGNCFTKIKGEINAEEKEHVTLYFKNRPSEFKLNYITNSDFDNLLDLRLTIDTKEDYIMQCALHDKLVDNRYFGLKEILELKKKEPWIFKINEDVKQKNTSFSDTYKCLSKNIYEYNEYKIVPLRLKDRFDIMKWRNEQMYHLRQTEKLTLKKQDNYFNTVISKIFKNPNPNQILFSFLKNDICIGYGGLVHINWLDKNAEISFIMDTQLEKMEFGLNWSTYLNLIEKVAFSDLGLHKIFTYAYDLRPQLFKMLTSNHYKQEATLKEHCIFNNKLIDVLIHVKYNSLTLRTTELKDMELYYNWVNEKGVRQNSVNSQEILIDDHNKWFSDKITDNNTKMFVLEENKIAVGQIRFDLINDFWEIDYSIDINYRKKGYGLYIIKEGIKRIDDCNIKALVKNENIGSLKVFEKLNFSKNQINNYFEYIM